MAKGKQWGQENLIMADRQTNRMGGQATFAVTAVGQRQVDKHKQGQGGNQTETVQHSSADTSKCGSMQQDR